MRSSLTKKIICLITSLIMVFSVVFSSAAVFSKESEKNTEDDLTYQSLDLYPNGEKSEEIVTLDGDMPEGATAEAIDVTDKCIDGSLFEDLSIENELATGSDAELATPADGTEATSTNTDAEDDLEDYSVIAAYDITILDGNEEYQPDSEHPISVSITNPEITENMDLRIWHIKDDGEREEINEFSVEDGKLVFDAYGFSVYEIMGTDDIIAKEFFDNLAERGDEGFYVSVIASSDGSGTNGPYYFTDVIVPKVGDNNRSGIKSILGTDSVPSGAVKLYFERYNDSRNRFYIYTIDDEGCRHYLSLFRNKEFQASRSGLKYTTDVDEATPFKLELNSNKQVRLSALLPEDGKRHYVTNNNNSAYVGYAKKDDSKIAWMTIDNSLVPQSVNLDNKTFGLMNFTGGTHGYALMADPKVHALVEVATHQTTEKEGINLFVDEGSEVTRWTFHKDADGKYKLSGVYNGSTKYLTVNGDSLSTTESEVDAVSFDVERNDDIIQLKYNGKYVSLFSNESAGETTYYYALSDTSSVNSKLNLIDFASLDDEDYYIYSAERVSVSDIKNGEKYIIYTRIWDDTKKRYDIYAVDHDGTLYPCYASGGKILWLGNGTGSLEWEFTEYYDKVTKEPNYYYELYNPYSEKYIAPQMVGNQILSDNTIGINLQGRRDGEFYSEILAWDNTYYTYVGFKPNEEKTKLVPSSKSAAYPFYFAKLEDMNLSDKLNEVETLDHKQYGITMKIRDYSGKAEQEAVVGSDRGSVDTKGKKGVLSTNVGSDGYPIAVQKNKSLKDLFEGATEVNHLFLENEYNTSGYFLFDSCQNFATICDENGNLKTPVDGVIDFTVYRELGTTDTGVKNTLRHGQFLPYNIIKPDVYTTKNPQNLFSALATIKQGDTTGLLPDSDPRKYEKLHKVLDSKGNDNPDYQYGVELSASFVQTVSGMDAWGHDIIFEFTGDDDFWLYVDDELVIDLGGNHSALAGSVNFRTGEVKVDGIDGVRTLRQVFEENYRGRNPSATDAQVNAYLSKYFDDGEVIFKDYSQHTMKVYYMEYGGGAANLNMKFNLASVTPGSVVLSKEISGDDNNVLDKDFIEYPFQIFYTVKDEQGVEHEYALTNSDPHSGVSYQNSNKPVTFVNRYKPPGVDEDKAYDNVFFINPTKKVEISFPDNTIQYRIVECAVDSSIYDNVLINGMPVPDERKEINGNYISYISETATAELHPTISFDNHVKDGVIKSLYIKKKLVDENGDEITGDSGKFSFRLYLASSDTDPDELSLANMYKYYVLSKNNKLCRHNYQTGDFIETTCDYSDEIIKDITDDKISGLTVDDVTFHTSGFGAISNIPSGYTIVVPGLPVGAVFKVTEDTKPGYGLDDYEMVKGYKKEGDQFIEINSYQTYQGKENNVGKVIVDADPRLNVVNKKGYGLTVEKNWSDLGITTYHDPIYVAVYVDGKLLDGTVRKLESPTVSTYYFWTTLVPYSSGRPRMNLDGYVVKEVKVENGNVTPLESGDTINLNAIPVGSTTKKAYDYNVSYSQGEEVNSTRTDVITNTREDGVAIRLLKWGSETPLKNGSFTLDDPSGNNLGTFTSDSEGIVNIIYEFERNKLYTLTQVEAPEGYVGLQKTVKFKISNDDKITLYNEDGTTIWGTDPKDVGWAESKTGQRGLTGFVDVHNKVFNFKIEKADSADQNNKLGAAHFALYKQMNTTVGGYVKNVNPMSGFEDIVTVNGEATICGGDSGRYITPGPNGTVFFLTETEAPPNYSRMTKDIVFKLSPTGVPSLVDAGDSRGELIETGDSYIYRLSVPNTKLRNGKALLSVTKTVVGSMGDRNKEFEFTFTVENPDSEGYEWYKNGVKQSSNIKSGDNFTLKHKDEVMFNLPQNAIVTVVETSTEYTTTIQKGSDAEISGTSIQVTMDADTKLTFKNKINDPTETGIKSGSKLGLILIVLISIIVLASNIYMNKMAKK